MSKKPAHLIKIENYKPETACGEDWIGANLTNDVNKVKCQRCINTDHYRKKLQEVNKQSSGRI
jgi:hypothetical protein